MTLKDVLLEKFAEDLLVYTGTIFGQDDYPMIETGETWVSLLNAMMPESLDEPVMDNPSLRYQGENHFFLANGETEIWDYDSVTKQTEKVFKVYRFS